MSDTCNCCDGLARITPESRYNRPGLAALTYRVGTYATFLETMLARLTTLDLSDDPAQMLRPLLELTTRELDDPSIALLDAWAVLADVLTFYQERLANEGYLRTARERRSILELGRLVGYEMRPGVAASVFLAFTVEDPDPQKPILIPAGTRVQSLPRPGELPQPFETSEDLEARVAWNVMRPRLSQVQDLDEGTHTIRIKGLSPNLKLNDPILIVDSPTQVYFRQVNEINPKPEQNVTAVLLRGDLELGILETQINRPLSPKLKHDLPRLLFPLDGAPDESISPELRWFYKTTGNNVVKFNIAWRKQDGQWNEVIKELNPLLNEIPELGGVPDKEQLYRYKLEDVNELDYNTPYEWRVTTTDDEATCIQGRPTRTFRTASEKSFSDLKQVEVNLKTWELSWRLNGDLGAIKAKLKYWKDGQNPDEIVWSEIKNPNTYTLEDLDIDTAYFWAVIAVETDQEITNPRPPSPQTFTTSRVDTFADLNVNVEDKQADSLTVTLSWRWLSDREDIRFKGEYIKDGEESVSFGPVDDTQYTFNLPRGSNSYPEGIYSWSIVAIDSEDQEIASSSGPDFTIGFGNSNPADQALHLSFNPILTWQWYGGNSNAFKVKLWVDGQTEPVEGVNVENVPQFSPTRPLATKTKYNWKVEATHNATTSRTWSFITYANFPQWMYATGQFVGYGDYVIISKLRQRLAKLKRDLENIETATARLFADVIITQNCLVEIQKLFQTLSRDSKSIVDFGCHVAWSQQFQKQLSRIKDQLNLRKDFTRIPKRAYPDEVINLSKEIIAKIETRLKLRPSIDFVPKSLEQYAKDIRDAVIEQIAGLESKIQAKGTDDQKVQLVKEILARLETLYYILRDLEVSNLPGSRDIYLWIGDPEQVSNTNNSLRGLLKQLITQKTNVSSEALTNLIPSLLTPPSQQPANSFQLERDVNKIFSQESDLSTRLLAALKEPLKNNLYQSWAQTEGVTAGLLQSLEILRVKAAPYGATSPFKVITGYSNGVPQCIIKQVGNFVSQPTAFTLDAEYKEIKPGGWVVVDWMRNRPQLLFGDAEDPNPKRLIRRIVDIQTISIENVGKLTRLTLDKPWIAGSEIAIDSSIAANCQHPTDTLQLLRDVIIYAQSEPLELAEEPIEIDVQKDVIHLDRLYQGLEAGRWLIVSGERTDIPRTKGVVVSERVMIAGIKHKIQKLKVGNTEFGLTDDKIYTTIELANEGLAYTYKRDTVTIYGNVVKATHGETRQEVLGHGDGSQVRQAFTLKQPPLTYLAAPTRKGVESTLEVRVNNIRWPEKENLLELGPDDRGYVTRTDNEQNTTIIFGDGLQGKRLPTGVENIKAVYRNGLGQAGNVAAEQISQLSTRPLGVKGVINPLPASGGADRETADQARWNVPRALLALDRLVSVSDYEDFARTFAGISKASAAKLFEGQQEVVHLSIAGVDDGSIAQDSDLYRALFDALERYGTLQLPLRIESRKLKLLVIIANVKIHPDYLWETIEPQLRAVLLATFSFERREIGQNALVSEAISVMQQVRGVEYVDIDIFTSISEDNAVNPDKLFQKLRDIANQANTNTGVADVKVNRADDSGDQIKPAEIAYLNPAVPDTLILKEIKG